jgi:hypothetical protein
VVKHQQDDRADRSDARAVNAVNVEAGHAGAAEKIEQPTAENCTNNAEQDVDDGSLARRAGSIRS